MNKTNGNQFSNANVKTVNEGAAPVGGIVNTVTPGVTPAKPDSEKPKPRKTVQKSPVDLVLAQYRKVYARQVDPTCEVNQKILSQAIATGVSSGLPEEKFLREIARRIDLLMSFNYFIEDCSDMGRDPYKTASHFVLSGWQALADYMLGRKNMKLQPTKLWDANPMFDKNMMISLDPHIRKMLPEKADQADGRTPDA